MKASKDKLVSALKELTGLQDIHFEAMNHKDLAKLFEVLSDMRLLAQIGLKSMRARMSAKVQSQVLDKSIVEVLQDNRFLTRVNKDNGPLGLGILPILRRELLGIDVD